MVAALTDQDPCDTTAGCSNASDFIWLESDEDTLLAHQLGHLLGLADESCRREAGSTCGLCHDGTAPPPNLLGSDLGCDPTHAPTDLARNESPSNGDSTAATEPSDGILGIWNLEFAG